MFSVPAPVFCAEPTEEAAMLSVPVELFTALPVTVTPVRLSFPLPACETFPSTVPGPVTDIPAEPVEERFPVSL